MADCVVDPLRPAMARSSGWLSCSSSTAGNPGNNPTQMFTGLTHVMASRVMENATRRRRHRHPITRRNCSSGPITFRRIHHFPPYSTTSATARRASASQHPEGGDQTNPNPNNPTGTSDFTENRWFRLLGFVEVPTRSHRGIDEPTNVVYPYQIAAGSINGSLGFYRTPGKININTLRYPDIVAGLVGEPDIFNMNFTPRRLPTGHELAGGSSVPYLLQDITDGDTVASPPPQNPVLATSTPRDWWEQFIATRDGVDPLPVANGGTGFSIPGLPRAPSRRSLRQTGLSVHARIASLPRNGLFRLRRRGCERLQRSARIEPASLASGRRGDTARSSDSGHAARPSTCAAELFELGTIAGALRRARGTTRRSSGSCRGSWATRRRGATSFSSGFRSISSRRRTSGPSLSPADTGVVRIGAKLGTSPGYRGFFVIDRSQALPLVTSQYLPQPPTTGQPFVFSFNQSFNWQSLVLYRQRIQ